MFFLLRLEHKLLPFVTRALWVPTIWMLHAINKPLGFWFPSSGADPESGSPLDRAFLTILMFVALWILFRRRVDWSSAMKENRWLIILIVLMLVSVLWSNIPLVSFKRWIREFQAILMAFVVLSEPSWREAIESILRRISYILIPFSVLLIKYFPKFGVLYDRWSGETMWIGVAQQKNGLTSLCLMSAFFLIWSLVGRWQGHKTPVWKYQTHFEIFLLLVAFWLMGGPRGSLYYSATSTYALAVGLLIYLGLVLSKKFGFELRAGVLTTIAAVIIIFGLVALFSGGTNLGIFASRAGRDATLKGRTGVWAALLPVAMQRPILGGGVGGFWTPGTREAFNISGAHSGYLDILLMLGFVGILLFSFYYLASCRKAHRELSYNFNWGTLWICYLIMTLVLNIAESTMDSFTSSLPAIILFITVSSTKALRIGDSSK
jgi:exopolysaccharide production protein ExoQ